MSINKNLFLFALFAILLSLVIPGSTWTARANTVQAPFPLTAPAVIYADSLAAPWQDWSWDTTRSLKNRSPVQNGKASIVVSFNKPWAAFYLRNDAGTATSGYTHLEFFLHGGSTGGQRLNLVVNNNSGSAYPVTATANAWTKISVPLSNLGSPTAIQDIFWQEATGAVQTRFYLDGIALVDNRAAASTPTSQPAAPTVTTVPATATKSAAATATATPPLPAAVTATATAAPTYLPVITNTPTSVPQSSGATIYADGLASGWQDWSWNTTRSLSSTSAVQSGSTSIAVTYSAAWGALYLHRDAALSTAGFTHLRFWIHGGTSGGQRIHVTANQNTSAAYPVTATAGAWTQVVVPLSSLGSPAGLNDIYWQDAAGTTQGTFYIDNIALVSSGTVPPAPTPPPGSGLALRVDAAAGQRPINPDIYGMNFTNEALSAELRLPVRRFGGNATTRYNWKNDTSNRASDWFFENIPNENSNAAALPYGSSSDKAVEQDRRTGTNTLMTVPMIGWTPKSRVISCGFSVSKYGAQQSVDPYRNDCGNGVRATGANITGNDPADTSIAIGPSFVTDFVKHLVSRYGTAANGGVKYYNLDNEPMLWNSTHRDVHPNPVGYDELRDRTYQYAAAVKAGDPSAKTLGPVLWGWTAYFYSALDAAPGGSWWSNPQDRMAHGNVPLVEWYLQQMRAYEQSKGVRILDYLDLHYYPQSNVALSTAGDAATQARRLRSTRSLWDASYTDESWINEPVRLIPRMRDWVNNNYPGTRLAITEYNFGGLESINGALAQADVLGIFGREGLDLATLWDPPQSNQPGAFAFRMYRNYDGRGSAFGETSVQAVSPNQDTLSIYAARRNADGALTVMVINKTGSTQPGALSLANFTSAAQAQVYRYSAANLNAVVRESDLAIASGSLSASFPANSITLIVIPRQ